MTNKYASPAVVEAVCTLDSLGMPVDPTKVARALQDLLSDLIDQGYEVLGVQPIHGGVLCMAVKRANEYGRVVRWYGCEGLTCRPNAHTLDCPNIDQP